MIHSVVTILFSFIKEINFINVVAHSIGNKSDYIFILNDVFSIHILDVFNCRIRANMSEKRISVLNVGVSAEFRHPFKSCCTDVEKVSVCTVKYIVSYYKIL